MSGRNDWSGTGFTEHPCQDGSNGRSMPHTVDRDGEDLPTPRPPEAARRTLPTKPPQDL